MENFEQVLDQYRPMIYSVLKKARVYKNYDEYVQVATIALWNAWRKYDPVIGPFPPYAYRTMLTTIYREMSLENKYADNQRSMDKEKLTFLAQQMELKNYSPPLCSDFLLRVKSLLSKEEFELLIDLYHNRYKYDELTKKYGVSVSALKKRRDRMIKRLRQEFQQQLESE
ncbi:MAG: sigma-70 family RNA polymerase sigma factor [Lysinibacillus sp.]|nr:sigma-70 family RNA polymerase sigma factor [Lysinibacillus sp.]